MAGNRLISFDDPQDEAVEESYPSMPIHLMAKLKSTYPNAVPTMELTQWEMGRLAGQQDVIYLIQRLTGTE